MADLIHRQLSGRIIDAAIAVHRELGPGLLGSAYEACLAYLLAERGLSVVRQQPVPVVFGEVTLDCGFRIDLLVEDRVIVELKSVGQFAPVHEAQLLSHMKLSAIRVGRPSTSMAIACAMASSDWFGKLGIPRCSPSSP